MKLLNLPVATPINNLTASLPGEVAEMDDLRYCTSAMSLERDEECSDVYGLQSSCAGKLSDTKSIFLILTSSEVMAGKLWHVGKGASLLTGTLPFQHLHGGEAKRLRHLPQIRPQLLVVVGGYKTLLYRWLHLQAAQLLLQQPQHLLSTMKTFGTCQQWAKVMKPRKR